MVDIDAGVMYLTFPKEEEQGRREIILVLGQHVFCGTLFLNVSEIFLGKMFVFLRIKRNIEIRQVVDKIVKV